MNNIKKITGIIISILFLFLAFRNADFTNIISILKEINFLILIFPIILGCIGLVQKALRWYFIIKPIKKEKFMNLFSVMMLGHLGNNVLPARMGELIRIYALEKNYGYNKSQTLATIAIEKIFDVLALLCFFNIMLFFVPFPSWVKNGGILLTFISLGVILFLYLFTHNKESAIKLLDFFIFPISEKLIKKIKEILNNFNSGLKILKKKEDLAIIAIHSLIIWMISFYNVHLVIKSFGLQLGLSAPIFLTIMLNLGMFIPSSPGYIGTYQFVCILALAPFGVEKELALSISIVLHVLMLVITTSIGMLCLWREKITLNRIKSNHIQRQ